ncbi:MAG: universal stress protein [Verrucomicrobiaceae bacterium]|nr:universal stress protein [Verrucomicrobiaceae bacterium]
MKTIVVLVDFSDLSFTLMKHAHALAKAFDSHVVLLHVVPQVPTVVDVGLAAPSVMHEMTQDQVRAETDRLNQMRDSLAKFGVNVTTRQFQGASVEAVLEEARTLDAELIIVGSHGHGPMYDLFVGSVTRNILRGSTCPVLVVPGSRETDA